MMTFRTSKLPVNQDADSEDKVEDEEDNNHDQTKTKGQAKQTKPTKRPLINSEDADEKGNVKKTKNAELRSQLESPVTSDSLVSTSNTKP